MLGTVIFVIVMKSGVAVRRAMFPIFGALLVQCYSVSTMAIAEEAPWRLDCVTDPISGDRGCDLRALVSYENRFGETSTLTVNVAPLSSGDLVVIGAEEAPYLSAFIAVDDSDDSVTTRCQSSLCVFEGFDAAGLIRRFIRGEIAIVGVVADDYITIAEEDVSLIGFADAYGRLFGRTVDTALEDAAVAEEAAAEERAILPLPEVKPDD